MARGQIAEAAIVWCEIVTRTPVERRGCPKNYSRCRVVMSVAQSAAKVAVFPELAAATIIVSVAEPMPAEFVAEIRPEVVATVVGVPVICPFDVLILRPSGNPVAP